MSFLNKALENFAVMPNKFQVIKYHEMIPAVADWRRIAAKYAEYEVYPYSEHSPFVDQVCEDHFYNCSLSRM